MRNHTVLIAGAGIAGPALAHQLHRYGFRPTVVERAAAPRSGGHIVDVRGTARTVVERMGLVPRIRQAHTGARGMAFVGADGKRVAELGTDVFGHSGGPVAEFALRRTDLARILHEDVRDDVEHVFGDSITGVDQREGCVRVTFASGGTREFGLLIGADGVHSGVRELVFGPEERYLHDLGCAVAQFSTRTELDLEGWQLMHTAVAGGGRPGRTAGLVPLPEPGRVLAGFFWRSAPDPGLRHDTAAQRDLVARTFAGDGWRVPEMLAALPGATDFYFDRIGQVRVNGWARGRTALLGDAAYCASPMSGIGTSLALVGAHVLAGELAAADGDHHRAYPSYERAMREFVDRAHAFAQGAGEGGLMPESRRQLRMRNRSVRLVRHLPRRLVARGMERVANSVELRDYPQRALRRVA
ncbi:FAD-dependent monooxygenase [Saccharopolyspora sp. NPDC047091]|uniref:FAD-dependent monooxygenase n=1 Tax=Saccharopolyspora sp. NPDC047091 TaxID=3155924 RepID=UPI0033F01C21